MSEQLNFRSMEDKDITQVIELWRACSLIRTWNDPRKDIAFARGKDNSDILVATATDKIIASIMVGHDGHRGSFYYVAVDPAHQRKGVGVAIMRAGEDWLRERGVWKVNVLIRQENGDVRKFYEKLGYMVNEVMSMGQRFIER